MLLRLTFLYLAIPLGIFFGSWLKIGWGGIFIALLVGQLVYLWKVSDKFKDRIKQNWKLVVIGGLLLLVWVYLGGSGGYVFQNDDWKKHNAILVDLFRYPWPISYRIDFVDKANLTYYLGWYILPAVVGKVMGSFEMARVAQFGVTAIGVLLVYGWILKILGKNPIKSSLFFIFFSFADILGVILTGKWKILDFSKHIDFWAASQYSSNTTLLYYVPGQALATWLTILVIYYLWQKREEEGGFGTGLIMVSLLCFWSPLGVIGVVPYLVVFWKKIFKSIPVLVMSVPIMGLLFLYYKANIFQIVYGKTFTGFMRIYNWYDVWRYLLFMTIEVGAPLVILIKGKILKDDRRKGLFLITAVILVCLPFIRFGLYNDLVMRASIGPLLLIWLWIFQQGLNFRNKWVRMAVIIYFILGGYTALVEINNGILRARNVNYKTSLNEYSLVEIEQQYLGYGNSLFSRIFLKEGKTWDFRKNTKGIN